MVKIWLGSETLKLLPKKTWAESNFLMTQSMMDEPRTVNGCTVHQSVPGLVCQRTQQGAYSRITRKEQQRHNVVFVTRWLFPFAGCKQPLPTLRPRTSQLMQQPRTLNIAWATLQPWTGVLHQHGL